MKDVHGFVVVWCKPSTSADVLEAVTFICLLITFAKQPDALAVGSERIYY